MGTYLVQVSKSLTSRYGSKREVIDLGEGRFAIQGQSRFFRGGMNSDNSAIEYADMEGGPFISVGTDYGFGKIKTISIEPVSNMYWCKLIVEVEK